MSLHFTEPIPDAREALLDGSIGELEAALLADLDAAEQSIWLAVYDLSRDSVLRSLADAAHRGVDVRIVTECENRFGSRAPSLAALENAGALVRDDRSSFGGIEANCPEEGGKMHHKFLVVDRHLVWAGSANLTPTDLNYNHNHAFRILDDLVAEQFVGEWEELWSGRFGRLKRTRPKASLEVDGVKVELGFSPSQEDHGASVTRNLVLGAVEQASSSITFALFALTDPAVTEAMGARVELVRGVVDATLADQSSSRARELCQLGAAIVVENLAGKVHHKLGVVDAGGEGAAVLGGSVNWSQSGFDENDETLVVAYDRALGLRAGEEIRRLLADRAHQAQGSQAGRCCFHSAEAYDAGSARCGDEPCVCNNGLDDDFDGRVDGEDSGCGSPFSCRD